MSVYVNMEQMGANFPMDFIGKFFWWEYPHFEKLHPCTLKKRLLPEKIREPGKFQEYYWRGFNIANGILFDSVGAHEAVSTTFLKIHVVPYVPKGSFDAYFCRAVKNNAYTILNKKRRRKLEERKFESEISKITETPQEAQIRKAKIEAVQTAIEMLLEPQRTVMWMKHVEGKTAAEIAEKLEMTERAVASHLYRGKKRLSELLPELLKPIYQ